MSEFPRITPDEFWELEFSVDEEMPHFDDVIETPCITVPTASGEVECRHDNSILVLYFDEWEDWSYVQVKYEDEKGQQRIRMIFGLSEEMLQLFSDHDYAVLTPPKEPIGFVKEQHYYYARGQEDMDSITERIRDEGM